MNVPLSLNHLLERAGRFFGAAQVVSRLLSAREIGSIAADAKDRFLIVDDILLLSSVLKAVQHHSDVAVPPPLRCGRRCRSRRLRCSDS